MAAAGTGNNKGSLDANPEASQWRLLFYGVLGMGAIGIFLVWMMESVDMQAIQLSLLSSLDNDNDNDMVNTDAAVMWEHAMEKRKGVIDARKKMLDGYTYNEKTVYDAFEADFSCPCTGRIGKLFGDGGKFVCGGPAQFSSGKEEGQKVCTMLSVGSNGDFSFETGIKEAYGCDIYTIDPTGDSDRFAEQAKQLGTHFAPIGLAGTRERKVNQKTNQVVEYMPIVDVLKKLNIAGGTNDRIDFIKIDCEGCEFASFEHIFDAMEQGRMEPVGQFFVEIHGTDYRKIRRLFERFDQLGYFVFHKERNHWGCMGYRCVEYSFIHANAAKNIVLNLAC